MTLALWHLYIFRTDPSDDSNTMLLVIIYWKFIVNKGTRMRKCLTVLPSAAGTWQQNCSMYHQLKRNSKSDHHLSVQWNQNLIITLLSWRMRWRDVSYKYIKIEAPRNIQQWTTIYDFKLSRKELFFNL